MWKGGADIKNYIVIVRDFDPNLDKPTDEYLRRLNRYYASPIVALDWDMNRDKAIDEFDAKYRKYFSHFFHLNYQLVEV